MIIFLLSTFLHATEPNGVAQIILAPTTKDDGLTYQGLVLAQNALGSVLGPEGCGYAAPPKFALKAGRWRFMSTTQGLMDVPLSCTQANKKITLEMSEMPMNGNYPFNFRVTVQVDGTVVRTFVLNGSEMLKAQ